MQIFLTGAAGFIGRALTEDLVEHGHTVLGLARNDANVEILTKLGVTPHRGDLSDLESLKTGARQSDAVIHLAFIHDFSNLAASIAADQAAINALGEAVAGTDKPLVIASGTLLTADGTLSTEDTPAIISDSPFSARARSAELVYELSKTKGVRGMVVRIPPTVHGEDDQGLIPSIIATAKKNGKAIYVGDGSQRWPTVNRYDCATLFRLAAEKGTAGATYHVVGEEGITMREINQLIGSKLGVPVQGEDHEEAVKSMSFLAHTIAMDNPCSSERTRKELGWNPTGPGLLQDMTTYYFTETASAKYA